METTVNGKKAHPRKPALTIKRPDGILIRQAALVPDPKTAKKMETSLSRQLAKSAAQATK